MNKLVLIIGANGNIGRLVSNYLDSNNFYIIESSSQPKRNQIKIDYKVSNTPMVVEGVKTAVICGRVLPPYVEDEIRNEIETLISLNKAGMNLIYIGSASSWLVEPNNYGKYKKVIEEKVLELGGTVLTCGLIYSTQFDGQISKIRKSLSRFPIRLSIKNSNFQFLTPLEAIFKTIEKLVESPKPRARLFVAHTERISFTQIINPKQSKVLFTLNLRKKFVQTCIRILGWRNSYFNFDSFNGLFGNYNPGLWEKALKPDFDLDEEFGLYFKNYFGFDTKTR